MAAAVRVVRARGRPFTTLEMLTPNPLATARHNGPTSARRNHTLTQIK
jgi:hypothetical protein